MRQVFVLYFCLVQWYANNIQKKNKPEKFGFWILSAFKIFVAPNSTIFWKSCGENSKCKMFCFSSERSKLARNERRSYR